MTPGAGTAQSVSRVGRRWMRASSVGSQFCCGRFVVLRRSSGRHKWHPCVCGAVECCFVVAGSWFCVGHPGVTSGARAFAGRSNVVLRRLVCGVARRGAIYDARCRNGTIGWPRWASADVACCGRFAVLYWSVRGIASVIRASQVAPLRLGVVECCFAVVIRASQVAPLRLRRLTVVWRRLVRGVARRGAIYDARCRNGTIRRPCGFFEPSGKGGLHSGGCPKILCFQIVVPHVCITFAA